MGLFSRLLGVGTQSTNSSQAARNRLRVIVESETRSVLHKHMPLIQKEIFETLAKYLNIPQKDFSMQIDEEQGKTILELCVHIPDTDTITTGT